MMSEVPSTVWCATLGLSHPTRSLASTLARVRRPPIPHRPTITPSEAMPFFRPHRCFLLPLRAAVL